MTLVDTLLGHPLASDEESEQKVGVWRGIPSLGLDALSSAAYGPEAALAVLLPLGAAGLAYIGPISLLILGLLTVLYLSYRQTIAAYPGGGGSYTVARENLGVWFGLLAAAALMLDYTLNVAVGISAGVGALISAVPGLHRYTLALCLGFLALITVINLRGAREAGLVFAIPTYGFVVSMLFVLGLGLFAAVHTHGHPHAIIAPHPLAAARTGVTFWLLLRAFASGCTAMTGVEAVSNGVTIFREPVVQRAQGTLTGIVALLGILLMCIAYLARAYGVGAMPESAPGYQSVISSLLAAIVGHGVLYYGGLGCTLAVLILSANTSYAGFPRLCRLVAQDKYLPHAFTLIGRRLVFTVGILFLSAFAGVLLIAFGGITDALIPLFAVGAFLAFTLSQAGMVVHWIHHNTGGRSRVALAINLCGAIATGAALGVILAGKFTQGAWITLVIIPALMTLFGQIHKHYRIVDEQTRYHGPLDLSSNEPPVVLMPIERWNLLTERALRFSLRLSPDIYAIHVDVARPGQAPEVTAQTNQLLQKEWQENVVDPVVAAGMNKPQLELLSSPYRKVSSLLTDYITDLQERHAGRTIAVVLPELVETRWWEWLLHNHRAATMKWTFRLQGNDNVVVVNVPWYLHRSSRRTHKKRRAR